METSDGSVEVSNWKRGLMLWERATVVPRLIGHSREHRYNQ